MSKANEIKSRMKTRNARESLMGEENKNNNININVNDVNNVKGNEDINEIINKKLGRKSNKELVGIYFEPEVKRALNKLQKLEGKGAKSAFVNNIAKWALKQKGLL
jgi:hypothetical protein